MSFEARYHGICSECYEHISPGDAVEFRKVDLLCHVHCPTPVLELKREVCPSCFQEKTPAGTCGCP